MDTYFSKFPMITYSNTISRDITRRCKIIANDLATPYLFYPYELNDSLRPDLIAEYYYNDPFLDWSVYMSNDIIDPYYGWYLTYENFYKHLIQKYGSVEYTKKKIMFFRNNWPIDDKELTPSYYNNNLPPSFRKYYTPILGVGTNIISYKRKEDNSILNTNRIMQYTISSNNNSIALEPGELVDFKRTGEEATVGTGEVEMSNSTIVRIKNTLNDYAANTTNIKDIVGETSGANISVNSSVNYFENFANTEANFWQPVYLYDIEVEENEKKKDLYLLGDDVMPEFVVRFEEKMLEETDENGMLRNA